MSIVRFDPFALRRAGTGQASASKAPASPASASSSNTGAWIGLGIASAAVLGLYLYSRRAGEAPTLVKGRDVRLVLTSGRTLRCPPAYGMIHDPSGSNLSRRYVYVGPFRRTRTPVELDASGREYLGAHYPAHAAVADVPSSGWMDAGDATQIIYRRDRGTYAERVPYEHTFSRPIPVARAGVWTRLDVGPLARINWRGFVSP